MEPQFYFGLNVLFALGGLGVAAYIHFTKRTERPLVCPVGFECDAVVQSEYGSFLGISNTVFGMAYYALIGLAYGIFWLRPELATDPAIFLLLGPTIVAALFSAYLIFIQGAVLKAWCSWCLASAAFSGLILWASLAGSELGFVAMLDAYKEFILLGHLLAAAAGLGGANVADVLFFRFLRDRRISAKENDVLNALSQVIWLALAVLVLTGIGLYLPRQAELHDTSGFIAKMVILLVLICNGALLNLLVAPQLTRIHFGHTPRPQGRKLTRLRRIAFACGAVSVVSWYATFLLGAVRDEPWSTGPLLGAYALVVAGGVVTSQILDRRWNRAGQEPV